MARDETMRSKFLPGQVGLGSLRRAVAENISQYHYERNQQGPGGGPCCEGWFDLPAPAAWWNAQLPPIRSGLTSSLEFLDRTGAYATNFDTHVQNFGTRRVTIIALV